MADIIGDKATLDCYVLVTKEIKTHDRAIRYAKNASIWALDILIQQVCRNTGIDHHEVNKNSILEALNGKS